MRYKVEYLSDPESPQSVCDVRYLYVEELPQALDKARADAAFERAWSGANGFLVRDLHDNDRIVAREAFASLAGK